MADLIPPDLNQCQAIRLLNEGLIAMGDNGAPEPQYERCPNVPVVLATPNEGNKGPMTLCQRCLDHLRTVVPLGYFTTEPIP